MIFRVFSTLNNSVTLAAGFSQFCFSSCSFIKKFTLGQLLWPEASATVAASAKLLTLTETPQREGHS